MPEPKWTTWQVALIGLALVAAAAFIASGVLRADDRAPVATLAPTATQPWPTPRPTKAATPTPTVTLTPTPALPPTATATPSPTPTPTPRVTLSRVQALGRLETARFFMQTVVDVEKEPNTLWQRMFGTDKILLIADGDVTAGFDMTKLRPEDVQVDGDSVSLTVPQAEILQSRVDNEKTKVYMRDTGFLVRPDPQFEGEARQMAEQRLVVWAEEHGIYARAEEYGRLYLEQFLRSLGFQQIEIRVRPAEAE